MDEHLYKVVEIDIKSKFTGYVKLGFENGELITKFSSNNPKHDDYPEVDPDFDYKFEFDVLPKSFYGSLYFAFDKGKITHYMKTQTLQGIQLQKLIR